MISYKRLEEQLKRINFHYKGWGRSEVNELCNIIMPDEEIEECVNGYYEAGFALLVGTKERVLLVDKKPLGYLTVEDLRFDMINELDLHHRLLGAQIKISAGAKTLHFTSMNQVRLRRLLNFVQARMMQIKKDTEAQRTAQKQHLEEMNEQLRLYLMAAHRQQYVEQANAIAQQHGGLPGQRFALPATEPPAMVFFNPNQPHPMTQQPYPDIPEAETAANTPQTPFEQAAAQAFEAQQQTQQPAPAVQPNASVEPPEAAAAKSTESQPFNPMLAIKQATGQVLQGAEQVITTPQQIGLSAVRRVVPVITEYTRLPLSGQRRRYSQELHQTNPKAA